MREGHTSRHSFTGQQIRCQRRGQRVFRLVEKGNFSNCGNFLGCVVNQQTDAALPFHPKRRYIELNQVQNTLDEDEI